MAEHNRGQQKRRCLLSLDGSEMHNAAGEMVANCSNSFMFQNPIDMLTWMMHRVIEGKPSNLQAQVD